MSHARREVVRSIAVKYPVHQDSKLEDFSMTTNFGEDVFNDAVMKMRLSSHVYQEVQNIINSNGSRQLKPDFASQIANTMKQWALERGATHFTHWFQPMTGLTAEKHDAFLGDVPFQGQPLLEFSGKALIKGETDGSSFPNGGLRSTFEARGYTVWDPVSPAFIRRYENGNVLCIPTSFISWTGEALDLRTPLLRSEEALSRQSVRMLSFLRESTKMVYSTLGAEQEFFFVDRGFFLARPDLVATGRTLIGAQPPKGQELEDHYFGSIHPRVMACLQEVEKEAWRLGVPIKTRHNEVSPAQHELAPIFERSSLAADHNMLLMELLRETGRKHGLECLLHEKPFKGVNGSGKHNNWSLCTSEGDNLLDPGRNPHTNLRFMVFLSAIIKAVDDHADILRASIATAANDHRLGAHEAPPAIISIFLGSQLEQVVTNVINGATPTGRSPSQTGEHRDQFIELGVSTLPPLPKDSTDRNRTSPFAFTGNKFEFRAVGSSQNCSIPVTALNTAVADSLDSMATAIERHMAEGKDNIESIKSVVLQVLNAHHRVCFGGNGYSAEWAREAANRGLPNYRKTPEALQQSIVPANVEMWIKHNVLSETEVAARCAVYLERYVHTVAIEANTIAQLAQNHVLPAAIKQQKLLAKSLASMVAIIPDFNKGPQMNLLNRVGNQINTLLEAIETLQRSSEKLDDNHEPQTQANFCRDSIIPAMQVVRECCDTLEELMDDDLWPLPKYSEMLFLR
eukprot:GILJ01002446.1.p1 GENE.GILJ01002446.1~~GILJ01002446.1.p1  ORF type:complete len:740 (+),score=123.38 GILJ01002446.1:119-2338(+)